MARSDHVCVVTGLYRSDCACAVEERFKHGDRCPACPRCRAVVEWLLVRSDRRAESPPKPPKSASE